MKVTIELSDTDWITILPETRDEEAVIAKLLDRNCSNYFTLHPYRSTGMFINAVGPKRRGEAMETLKKLVVTIDAALILAFVSCLCLLSGIEGK